MQFPKTTAELSAMMEVLQFYMEDHYLLVVIAFISIFIK